MSKHQGASGPVFFLCPKARLLHYRRDSSTRRLHHPIERTGRMRHRKNRYGRNHQDEFRCACGHAFWSNFYYDDCPTRRYGTDKECPAVAK